MRMTQEMEDDEKGKLFVGGLSWETTQDNLQRYFSRYGEVIDCVVMKNNESGRSRGFGFVTFADPANVNIVLQSGPHALDGRTIDPKPCNPRTLQKPKRGGGYPKVFLGGLPSNVTETDLRLFFAQYGKVMEVVIMYDQEKKKSRGFGFLSFEDEASVDRVTGEHYINIHGKQVEIKKAEPRDGSTQPPNNNSNNHQFNNLINNNISNHHHHHNQHIQQPHQHHPLPLPHHHMHLNHHRNMNNTNNSGSSNSSVVNNNNKMNNSTDNTQWGPSIQPQGAPQLPPLGLMQQQPHPNGPNGPLNGGSVNVGGNTGGVGVAPMNPMAAAIAPNMIQGYQGGWGSSPQQNVTGGGGGTGYGYGAHTGPSGSYGGAWGAPPPPPGPQAPPPPHQWGNYAAVQQQTQNYGNYDMYQTTPGPNGTTATTGTGAAGSWNTWNTNSPAGGVSAGEMYSRSAPSAGPGSGGPSNNVNKTSDYNSGYPNVVPTVTGYGNYANDQNSTYASGAPRNYGNDGVVGTQPVGYVQPSPDEFLKQY